MTHAGAWVLVLCSLSPRGAFAQGNLAPEVPSQAGGQGSVAGAAAGQRFSPQVEGRLDLPLLPEQPNGTPDLSLPDARIRDDEAPAAPAATLQTSVISLPALQSQDRTAVSVPQEAPRAQVEAHPVADVNESPGSAVREVEPAKGEGSSSREDHPLQTGLEKTGRELKEESGRPGGQAKVIGRIYREQEVPDVQDAVGAPPVESDWALTNAGAFRREVLAVARIINPGAPEEVLAHPEKWAGLIRDMIFDRLSVHSEPILAWFPRAFSEGLPLSGNLEPGGLSAELKRIKERSGVEIDLSKVHVFDELSPFLAHDGAFHHHGEIFVYAGVLAGATDRQLAAILFHEAIAPETFDEGDQSAHARVARRVKDVTGIEDEQLQRLAQAAIGRPAVEERKVHDWRVREKLVGDTSRPSDHPLEVLKFYRGTAIVLAAILLAAPFALLFAGLVPGSILLGVALALYSLASWDFISEIVPSAWGQLRGLHFVPITLGPRKLPFDLRTLSLADLREEGEGVLALVARSKNGREVRFLIGDLDEEGFRRIGLSYSRPSESRVLREEIWARRDKASAGEFLVKLLPHLARAVERRPQDRFRAFYRDFEAVLRARREGGREDFELASAASARPEAPSGGAWLRRLWGALLWSAAAIAAAIPVGMTAAGFLSGSWSPASAIAAILTGLGAMGGGFYLLIFSDEMDRRSFSAAMFLGGVLAILGGLILAGVGLFHYVFPF